MLERKLSALLIKSEHINRSIHLGKQIQASIRWMKDQMARSAPRRYICPMAQRQLPTYRFIRRKMKAVCTQIRDRYPSPGRIKHDLMGVGLCLTLQRAMSIGHSYIAYDLCWNTFAIQATHDHVRSFPAGNKDKPLIRGHLRVNTTFTRQI